MAAGTAEVVAPSPPRGRAMLHWSGKRPLGKVGVPDARQREAHGPVDGLEGNLLLEGDNRDALALLLARGLRGRVKLIYLDPPFDSGASYVRKVRLRGPTPATDGPPPMVRQVQYADTWSEDDYLQFLYERLLLLADLLADGGALFLHCDPRRSHHLRCVLEEVLGAESFVNEIVWSYRRWPTPSACFQPMHDTLLYHAREDQQKRTFHRSYEPASPSYLRRFKGRTQRLDERRRTRKIPSEAPTRGMPLRDVWEIPILAGSQAERTGYPTQKPERLLERVIASTTDPGDLVLDPFAGSGTSPAVATRLGRRWIACDRHPGALRTTTHRLWNLGQPPSFARWQVGEPPAPPSPPPDVRLEVGREGDVLEILVREVHAPALLEGLGIRLPLTAGWAALVDAVHIDPSYDGEVFRPTVIDAPPRRRDLVRGRYRLPAPPGETLVAVRVVDLLGGERLVTRRA